MSFIRILNKMGPNIDPCGIPDRSIWKTLSMSFIFTPYFLHFKYECTKVTASSDKPYAWSFAANKSWRIQSRAADRSVRIVLTKFLLSRDFFQISISLIRHDLDNWIFYKLTWNLIIFFSIRRKVIVNTSFINFRHSI